MAGEPTPGHAISESEDDAGLHDQPGQGLRHVAARGTLINAAFQIGLSGLGTFRRIAVAAFLTREEFGLWGVILPIIITLAWIKEIGVADKYIQQREADQETEWQRAFTLELMMSTGFFVLMCGVFPLYSLAYGHEDIIVPGVVLSFSMVISAFQTPAWIPYRRLQYARHRALTAIDPVIAAILTIVLGALGAGYWSLVIGVVAGSIAGSVVCVATCPYPIRLRFDRSRLRSYWSFSWPIMGGGLSRMIVVQGSLLTANRTVGLAGIGAIGLASSIATFADRVDGIVSGTLYPAVVRVVDRVEAMAEAFVKSNRIALMWAMPFALGLALFAGDFVDHVLGERWRPAVGLLAAVALTYGFAQVGFNWGVFMRAVGNTKPLFVAAVLDLSVFFVVSIPAMLEFGLAGYAAGLAATTVVQLLIRGWFMARMFPGFNVWRQLIRGLLPVVPGTVLILLVRELAPGGRTLGRAIAEVIAFALITVVATYLLERRLIREAIGYLRRAPRTAAPAAT
jgi:O-antigen/teichoic acid export membrane protein